MTDGITIHHVHGGSGAISCQVSHRALLVSVALWVQVTSAHLCQHEECELKFKLLRSKHQILIKMIRMMRSTRTAMLIALVCHILLLVTTSTSAAPQGIPLPVRLFIFSGESWWWRSSNWRRIIILMMMRFDLEREVDCWMILIIPMVLLLSRMINHGMILVKLMIIPITRMFNQDQSIWIWYRWPQGRELDLDGLTWPGLYIIYKYISYLLYYISSLIYLTWSGLRDGLPR